MLMAAGGRRRGRTGCVQGTAEGRIRLATAPRRGGPTRRERAGSTAEPALFTLALVLPGVATTTNDGGRRAIRLDPRRHPAGVGDQVPEPGLEPLTPDWAAEDPSPHKPVIRRSSRLARVSLFPARNREPLSRVSAARGSGDGVPAAIRRQNAASSPTRIRRGGGSLRRTRPSHRHERRRAVAEARCPHG